MLALSLVRLMEEVWMYCTMLAKSRSHIQSCCFPFLWIRKNSVVIYFASLWCLGVHWAFFYLFAKLWTRWGEMTFNCDCTVHMREMCLEGCGQTLRDTKTGTESGSIYEYRCMKMLKTRSINPSWRWGIERNRDDETETAKKEKFFPSISLLPVPSPILFLFTLVYPPASHLSLSVSVSCSSGWTFCFSCWMNDFFVLRLVLRDRILMRGLWQ